MFKIMEILRIPSAYYSQIKYLNKDDCEYVLKTIFALSCGEDIKIEKSLRGGLVLSIWREAIQMENKARAKKGKKWLEIDIATLTADTVDTLGCGKCATKSNQVKTSQNKSNQNNILSKDNTETSSEIVKVNKRDFEIDLIIEALKECNMGIVDDTVKKQRQYGKLIKDKMSKIKGFDGRYKEFILMLYNNSDEYRKCHFRSLEKFYYEMANIISRIKIKSKKQSNMIIC